MPQFSNVLPPAAALHVLEFIGSAACPPNVLTRLTLAILQLHKTEVFECRDPAMLHVLLTRLPSTTVDVSTLCALAASSELVGCDKINTERSAVVARVDNDMVQMERKQRAMDAFKHVDDNHDRQLGFEEFKKLLPQIAKRAMPPTIRSHEKRSKMRLHGLSLIRSTLTAAEKSAFTSSRACFRLLVILQSQHRMRHCRTRTTVVHCIVNARHLTGPRRCSQALTRTVTGSSANPSCVILRGIFTAREMGSPLRTKRASCGS